MTYTNAGGTTRSQSLTYDSIGNPLTYFNGDEAWDLTWRYGRQLASASNGTDAVSYTYDADGIRKSKTVNDTLHEYVTLDGKVVRETIDSGYTDILVDYLYDNEGKPYKLTVTVGSAVYEGYHVLNQQGDVIAILDENRNVLVEYSYNAWGRVETCESEAGSITGSVLKEYNALKYRGYYHDEETGVYYVSFRYYDPEIGRWINADIPETLTADFENFAQYNLFAYCFNNPVNMSDETGTWPSWAKKVVAAVAVGASRHSRT